MKKFVYGVVVLVLTCSFLRAEDAENEVLGTTKLTITPFGELGGLYNQGVGNNHSYGNLMAHAGVNFILDNGLDFGLGVIGGWAIWDKTGGSQFSPNVTKGSQGDLSEVFVHYKNSRLEFAVGRFNANFLGFDYMSGNIQGAAGAITTNDGRMHYWAMFADSMLYTGANRNTSSTLYGTNMIYNYNPNSKRNIMGSWGEVLAAGFDYTDQGFDASIFTLIDTRLPANQLAGKKGALFQLGGKLGYEMNFSGAWHSKSILRGIFQSGNTSASSVSTSGSSGLIWLDQTFVYRVFEFGGGLYGIFSSNGNGGIYTFSDPTRYYGKIINAPGTFPSPYFSSDGVNQLVNGYIFGSIDLMKSALPFRIDGIITFGRYQEYSFLIDYDAWKYHNMKLNVGIGYVFSKVTSVLSSNPSNNNLQSSFLVFSKFSY